MKKIFILSFILIHLCSKAYSITLYDALKQTYNNNTQLNAERENFKASEEDINISKAEYKPSLTLSGSKSIEETNKLTNQSGGDATINDVDPFTTSIKLEQTLLDFDRGITHKRNIIGLDLAKAKLIKKEQDIIYEAIEAYTQLILTRETLEINKKNLDLLKRQVENDKIRLDRGQSAIVNIPESLNDAISISKTKNPDILIAKFELNQTEKDLESSKADLKPTAALSLERSYSEDVSSTVNEREKDTLTTTLSWPFYSGGKKRSTINKNANLTSRKRLLLDDTIQTNETNVTSAWSSLESSKSFLESVKVQVRAAKIANEGIVAEYERGSRTTLDVIQSNALLLSAQISLASSERNYLLSQYDLLKSVGLLNSEYLKLK